MVRSHGVLLAASVDVTSMADFDDHDHQKIVLDFVDDPVRTLTNPIPLLSRQFLAARSARILCQGIDARQDAGYILLRKVTKILGD